MNILYVAYYSSVPIAADYHKRTIRDYMEIIRGVKRKKYQIGEVLISSPVDEDPLSRILMNQLIPGYILPARDCDAIQQSINHYDEQHHTSLCFLKELERLSDFADESELHDSIQKCIAVLQYVGEKKMTKKLLVSLVSSSYVLRIPMHEYLQFVRNDTELTKMNREFKDIIQTK